MFLSPGGGDATEMREFNAAKLSFVENGFILPMKKSKRLPSSRQSEGGVEEPRAT